MCILDSGISLDARIGLVRPVVDAVAVAAAEWKKYMMVLELNRAAPAPEEVGRSGGSVLGLLWKRSLVW